MNRFHVATCFAALSGVATVHAQGVTDNAFNPAISVILNGKYAPFTNSPDTYSIPGYPLGGEAGVGEKGLYLDETELVFSGNIDDWFYGNVTAALHSAGGETEVELEEAYLDTLGLGAGLTLRAGRFFSSIGYMNEQHPHSWDFVDAALPYRALLGRQFGDDGIQLRWVAPTALFTQVGAEVFRGQSYPAGGGEDGAGAYTAFVKLGGDAGFSNAWQVGLAGLWAEAEERVAGAGGHAHGGAEAVDAVVFNGDVNIAIADLVWKWAPGGNPALRNFKLQTEFVWRNEDGQVALHDGAEVADYNGVQQGWYVQGVYQFRPHWRVGARYGRLWADNEVADEEVLEEAGLHDEGHTPQRYSLMLDYARSEFSRLRLQYNRDESRLETDNQVFLQYIVSLGAHGAHKF